MFRFSHFKHGVERLVDIVLPPRAALPDAQKGEAGYDHEWAKITFLDDPCCHICGFPFEFDQGAEALCARCLIKPPDYDRARAALAYDDHSRDIVLGFKHGGYLDNLDMIGSHMARAGRASLSAADYLIPVPLHPTRLIKRRYNQSSILARALARKTSARFDPDILFRDRATPIQGGQTAKGRHRNVRGAFSVPDKIQSRIEGKNLLLIDDVLTTGATVNACAKTLKRAGAARVDALMLARVVKAAPIPT